MTDFFLADSDATELLGQWLAPAALIELRGDLGAGSPPRPRAAAGAGRAGRDPQSHHTGRALSAGQWR